MLPGDQGPYVLATYFMSSTLSQYKGTGYEVDLGYKLPIQKIALGVQLSYKMFKYNDLSGGTVDPPYQQEYFDPYFAFIVGF